MANVLSVLEKATDDALRNQVATLEVVTIRNIMSTEGMKMADKAAGAVNTVGRLLGRKKQLIKDMKPSSIDEQIKERIEERAGDSRLVLEAELRRLLAERLGLKDDPSDELIARALVNDAAKHMGIEEVLAPAEKIDAVYGRYMERLEEECKEAVSALGITERPVGWTALAMSGIWQHMKGTSKVDGEIYCQLVLAARALHNRCFAPEDDDLPDWIIGKDEESQREIERSDVSYQEREKELKEAQAVLEEAARNLSEAQGSREAARRELERQRKHIADVQAKVEGYEGNRQGLEVELGVLEGELLMAADADKKSTLTINKLKREILKQREKIINLQKTHEKNLLTIEDAPRKEIEIKQLIEKAEEECEKELASTTEAKQVCDEAREARDAELEVRVESVKQGLRDWLEQDYSGKDCEMDDMLISQLAMSNNEQNKAVLKVMKQVLDADTPRDLGDEASEGSLGLPIGGTGRFLVYEADEKGKLCFLKVMAG